MSAATLRVGTRASVLATTQSRLVADVLRERLGRDVELVEVSTEGDRSQASGVPLQGAASTGVFVAAVREALLRGDVDVAVHSLKDLPTAPADGIVLAAVPQREDPRDVVVARDGLTLGELPAGSRVGTGSPRRVAQLHALGLGLEIAGIRGNVDTRIGKVRSGEYDAVILARAGLARIGRLDEVTEVLDPLQMLPAPGQGALAVECRTDDPLAAEVTAALDTQVVEVRLNGREVQVVVTDTSGPEREEHTPPPPPPPPPGGEGNENISRMTVRLFEELKGRAEQAAQAQGVSLNTFVQQAVQGALHNHPKFRAWTEGSGGWSDESGSGGRKDKGGEGRLRGWVTG